MGHRLGHWLAQTWSRFVETLVPGRVRRAVAPGRMALALVPGGGHLPVGWLACAAADNPPGGTGDRSDTGSKRRSGSPGAAPPTGSTRSQSDREAFVAAMQQLTVLLPQQIASQHEQSARTEATLRAVQEAVAALGEASQASQRELAALVEQQTSAQRQFAAWLEKQAAEQRQLTQWLQRDSPGRSTPPGAAGRLPTTGERLETIQSTSENLRRISNDVSQMMNVVAANQTNVSARLNQVCETLLQAGQTLDNAAGRWGQLVGQGLAESREFSRQAIEALLAGLERSPDALAGLPTAVTEALAQAGTLRADLRAAADELTAAGESFAAALTAASQPAGSGLALSAALPGTDAMPRLQQSLEQLNETLQGFRDELRKPASTASGEIPDIPHGSSPATGGPVWARFPAWLPWLFIVWMLLDLLSRWAPRVAGR